MRVHLYGRPELSVEVSADDELCAACVAVHENGKRPGIYFIQLPTSIRRVEVYDEGMQVMVCEEVTDDEAKREIAAAEASLN